MPLQCGEATTSSSLCAVYSSFTAKRIAGITRSSLQTLSSLSHPPTFQLPVLHNHVHRTAIYRHLHVPARYMTLFLSVYSITHLILTKLRSFHCLTTWRTMTQLRQLCQQAIWAVPEWYVFVNLSPFFAHFRDQPRSAPIWTTVLDGGAFR